MLSRAWYGACTTFIAPPLALSAVRQVAAAALVYSKGTMALKSSVFSLSSIVNLGGGNTV